MLSFLDEAANDKIVRKDGLGVLAFGLARPLRHPFVILVSLTYIHSFSVPLHLRTCADFLNQLELPSIHPVWKRLKLHSIMRV